MSRVLKPRGPAADPEYPPSNRADNPYGFSPQLLRAAQYAPKVTDKYVFFFGYEGSDPHVALQQWFPAPFAAARNPYKSKHDSGGGGGQDKSAVVSDGEGEEVVFPTSEHYMMYHKALLMGDEEVAAQIVSPTHAHPSAAKRLGREVRNFDLDIWTRNADRVVEEGNFYKFSQNADLRHMLIATGDREIVETSPDDKIWGIGFNTQDAEGKEAEWGNNGLGKALVRVRERLKKVQH